MDDEPDVVELLEFNLTNAGFSVIRALNGAEAIGKARIHQPHLIILDILMPEMTGFEVCKVFRRDPATAETFIILVTACASEIDRVLGLELGANDYVTKPFSPREVVLRVKRLLQGTVSRLEGAPGQMLVGDIALNSMADT